MNSIEHLSHPKPPTKASKTRRRVATAAVAIAGLSLSTACSTETSNGPRIVPVTTSTPRTDLLTTLPPRTSVEKPKNPQVYVENAERNNQIGNNVFKAAEMIQTASMLGAIGYLDFYNTQTSEWQSQTPNTTGWGWFQHNPQYGGTKNQLSFYAFRNPDGSVDSDQGILGLRVQAEGKPMVAFESGEMRHIENPKIPAARGWDVTVSDGSKLLSTTMAKSDTEVVVIDTLAQNEIDSVINSLAAEVPKPVIQTPSGPSN